MNWPSAVVFIFGWCFVGWVFWYAWVWIMSIFGACVLFGIGVAVWHKIKEANT